MLVRRMLAYVGWGSLNIRQLLVLVAGLDTATAAHAAVINARAATVAAAAAAVAVAIAP